MVILVIGKNGQLGKSINKIVTNNEQTDKFIFVGRDELDLSSNVSITSYFAHNNFDIIINCAAHTAVDKVEEQSELANQINHLAVAELVKIAKMQQAKLIHISTDYVFDGESDKPYKEADKTNPINIYGRTKLAGEQALQEIMPTDAMIIRTSWVYSEFGNNFVKTILKLSEERDEINVVCDQVGSPTYATDLANAILDTLQNKAFKEPGQETQVYHYSNSGEVSWYDFAREVFELTNIQCSVSPISTEEYPTLAKRPKNTLMNKDKIAETFSINIFDWKESLNICMAIIKEHK